MKKNNIALALALLATGCAAGPALAQSTSSVSLYGIIDVSVRAQSGLSGANAPAAGSMGSVNSGVGPTSRWRSEEHTSELQSQSNLVCRLLLEKKNTQRRTVTL